MNPALERFTQFAGDMFMLVPPDAPAAIFCGAMFSVGGQRFPAGAADIDPQRAKIRCLGEVAETIAQFVSPDDLKILSAGSGLDANELRALELLSAGADGPWLAATRLSGGQPVSIPASLCLRSVDGVATKVSSLGCAAGETRESAIRSALFELIERDAVALWWQGGVPPLEIPESSLAEARSVLELARQGKTGRVTRFLALQSISHVPVVCTVSSGADGKSVALGFGAAESFAAATIKSLMELLQMEVGNRMVSMKVERQGTANLSSADAEIWQRMLVFEAFALPFQPYGKVAVAPDFPDATIAEKLAIKGIQVYATDLYRDTNALPVVKLIAPGLQPLPGKLETERLAHAKKTHMNRLRHFPKVAVL